MNDASVNLGRNYLIQVETPPKRTVYRATVPMLPSSATTYSEVVHIAPPISATIDITRNVTSDMNHAEVTLVNLGEDTRNKLYKDKYNTVELWKIRIAGGYGDDLKTIFLGNIQEAYSYHEGTEWYTVLICQDGLWAVQNGTINASFSYDVPKQEIIRQIIASMGGLGVGVLGESTRGESPRGRVEEGDSWECLQEITGDNVFIDDGMAHVLLSGEVIEGQAFVIDADLLRETPMRRETFLVVEANFSPGVKVGTICKIQGLDERFNGQYAVKGIVHHLEVSSADAGDAYTTISLDAGAKAFSALKA